MKVYNNIELLQVNLSSGNDRFYFPDNSKLNGKVINSLSFYGALLSERSPFDGRQVLGYQELQYCYISVVKDNKEVLHENVPLSQSVLNKLVRVDINSVIDFNLCSVSYVGNGNLDNLCLLVYATYDTKEVEDYMQPVENIVTINVNTNERAIRLDSLIDDYIIAQKRTIKRVECFMSSNELVSPSFYLDMRDYGGRSFKYVPWIRMMNGTPNDSDLGQIPVDPLLLDDFNVDFRNSWIINSGIASQGNATLNTTILFYY